MVILIDFSSAYDLKTFTFFYSLSHFISFSFLGQSQCVIIRFMKLRLDRVLTESFEAESLTEALASNPTDLQFEKPTSWVAPYPKYEFGWWEPFLPPKSSESEA